MLLSNSKSSSIRTSSEKKTTIFEGSLDRKNINMKQATDETVKSNIRSTIITKYYLS